MTRAAVLKAVAVVVCLPMATACATGHTFADLAVERDHLTTIQSQLTEVGRLPSQDVMSPQARLVSFPYSLPGSMEERRDTVVGAEAVATWLEQWHARQLPQTEFVLSPVEVRRCGDIAIQDGSYNVATSRDNGRVQSYRALWVEQPGGTWVLDRLWLDPDAEAHTAKLATGCRSLSTVKRALNRVILEVEAVAGTAPAKGVIEDAMRDAEWDYGIKMTPFPRTEIGRVAFAVGATYKVRPDIGIQALFIQEPSTTVHGRWRTHPREPILAVEDRVVAVLGVASSGDFEVAVGPAVSLAQFSWEERFNSLAGVDPVSESRTGLGALGQVAVSAPVAMAIQPRLVVRYILLPGQDAPGFYDLAPLSVPFRRFTVGLGFRYSF